MKIYFILFSIYLTVTVTGEPLGYLKPTNSVSINNSPWGVQAGENGKTDLFKQAGILGVKWTRLQASWPIIESKKGQYDFSSIDDSIDAALANGVTPFVCISNGNQLYSGAIPRPDPDWRLIYGVKPAPPILDKDALAAWLHFVDATISHAKNRVKYWEIWNEPNHYAYWGAPPDANSYGNLVSVTAERIRASQPNAVIIAGALAGLDPKFVAGFLSEDKLKNVNVVSFHNYAALPEARMYLAEDTWAVLKAHNPKLQLWQGECGYPSASSTKDFRGVSPWGEIVQAKWLLRQAFVDTYFMRCSLSNYFKLYDGGDRTDRQKRPKLKPIDSILGYPAESSGRRVRGNGVNEKCLLSNPDLNPKPAFFAYKNLTAVFDGRYAPIEFASKPIVTVFNVGQFFGVGDNDDAYPSVPLVAGYRSTKGNSLIAYWVPWQPQEYTPKPARINLRVLGVKFNAPVIVNLLDGSVQALTKQRYDNGVTEFLDLPLLDYPVIIVERSEVVLVSNRTTPPCDAIPTL